jgi:cytidylate kinase
MWKNIGLEQCLSFINCQLSPGVPGRSVNLVKPAITISRLTGAGGFTVASKLAAILQAKVPRHAPWTVFDRKLVEQVLEDHHLSKRVAEFMPENHKSMLTDIFEELLGLHPSSWTLVHQTSETILHLAKMGNVILLGRGASVITSRLDNVFHVRLVGSVAKRIERVQAVYQLDRPTAITFVDRGDKGRRRYLKEHFHEDIDNPLLYHLIINTDRIGYDVAARLIGDEVIRRFQLDRPEVAVENWQPQAG